MNWRELVVADQRLALLQILAEAPGYELGSAILRDILARYGHLVSHDSVATQLMWLDEQGLISLATTESIRIAKLSTAGLDVAQGRAGNPGVAHPVPGA